MFYNDIKHMDMFYPISYLISTKHFFILYSFAKYRIITYCIFDFVSVIFYTISLSINVLCYIVPYALEALIISIPTVV